MRKDVLVTTFVVIALYIIGCENVTSLSVQPMEIEFQSIGQEIKLDVKALNQQGIEVKNPKIIFRSRDPEVAEVTFDGRVIARSNGATTIEVISGEAMEFVHVKVRLPETLIIRPNSLLLNIAGVKKLTPLLLDKLGQEIKGVQFKFTSSDPEGLKVSSDGTIVAVKEGKYEVKVEALGKVAQVKVEVPPFIPPYERGKITTKKLTKKKGEGSEEKVEYEDPRLQLFNNLP